MLAALVPLTACGGGSGGDGDRPAATGQGSDQTETAAETASTEAGAARPCSQERHLVVFDFAGFLTAEDELDVVARWVEGIHPTVRPGALELAQAYRERGYELLYVTAAPRDLVVDGLPAPTAVLQWLTDTGFPVDEQGTQVHGYTGDANDVSTAILAITDELLRYAGEGVHLDAGYTDDAERVYPLASGGIPPERIYTIGPDAGVAGTTALANDDLQTHLGEVRALPQVCTPG